MLLIEITNLCFMEISKNYAYFGCLWQTVKLAIYVYAYLNLMIHKFLQFFTGIYLVCLHFSDFNESYIPYSGKFSEGKIFGNLPFTNTSEINFWKPSVISNL